MLKRNVMEYGVTGLKWLRALSSGGLFWTR